MPCNAQANALTKFNLTTFMVPCECYIPVGAHEIDFFCLCCCLLVGNNVYRSYVNQSRPNNLLKGFLNHYIPYRMNNRKKIAYLYLHFFLGLIDFFCLLVTNESLVTSSGCVCVRQTPLSS